MSLTDTYEYNTIICTYIYPRRMKKKLVKVIKKNTENFKPIFLIPVNIIKVNKVPRSPSQYLPIGR